MKTLLTTSLLIACLSLQAQPSTGRILTDGVVITAEDVLSFSSGVSDLFSLILS